MVSMTDFSQCSQSTTLPTNGSPVSMPSYIVFGRICGVHESVLDYNGIVCEVDTSSAPQPV